MASVSKREWLVLIIGDVAAFTAALWLTLFLRHVTSPTLDTFLQHLSPFSFLFLVWIAIFVIAGLYGRHSTLFKSELPNTVITAQAVNIVVAALFFSFIPSFGIAPKTVLAIYVVISSLLIISWRLYLFDLLGNGKRQKAAIIGSGKELHELVDEVNKNHRYRLEFVHVVDLAKVQNPNDIAQDILKRVVRGDITTLVANTRGKQLDTLMPLFYNLSFVQSQVQVVDFGKLYEEAFERVPLSLVSYDWLIENGENEPRFFYSSMKRIIDLFFSILLFCIFVVLLPVIYIAVLIDDHGKLFIHQERMGKDGKHITVMKLRTMTSNEQGAWIGETKNKVTRIGSFLRLTSIDELPQIFTVLSGKLSFIGPRSDVVGLAERLGEAIPFYNARYKVVPGISGWAQINQRYAPGKISPQSIEESRVRLAYDLYYVKHRSVTLDFVIALRTLKTLLGRFVKIFI